LTPPEKGDGNARFTYIPFGLADLKAKIKSIRMMHHDVSFAGIS